MTKIAIGIKNFRQNISQIAKKAQEKNQSYIVTYRNKPILEINPCYNEDIFDDDQIMYYKLIEENMKDWLNDENDNLFEY